MKVFWSWQSDHPGVVSRHLVHEALQLAVTSRNEELAFEEPEREVSLDRDRKGLPGSPDLASVILGKIRASDVFVADVTPVGSTAGEPPKKLMNSNVAIELGYALHTITDRRCPPSAPARRSKSRADCRTFADSITWSTLDDGRYLSALAVFGVSGPALQPL